MTIRVAAVEVSHRLFEYLSVLTLSPHTSPPPHQSRRAAAGSSGGRTSELPFYWAREMLTLRRFPPPWSFEDIGAAFVVKDGSGQVGHELLSCDAGHIPMQITR